MKSAAEFVKFCFERLPQDQLIPGEYYIPDTSIIGSVPAKYLMGTTGQVCTQWRLDYAYNKYYADSYTPEQYASRTANWVSNGVFLYDCEGLLDAYTGLDTTAAGCYQNWCDIKGDDALDYIMNNGELAAGACVFKRNSAGRIYHVGFVVGVNASGIPLIIEAKSFTAGITMSTLADGWNEYGIPNRVLEFQSATQTRFMVTSPMQQGEKYLLMQRALTANGYSTHGLDGKWGNNSQAAFDEMMRVNRKPVIIKVTANGNTISQSEV